MKARAIFKSLAIIFLFASAGFAGAYLAFKKFTPAVIVTSKEPIGLRTYHYPASFVASLKGDPQAGAKIYRQYCQACHAPEPEIELNAPSRGNMAVWKALSTAWGEEQLWQFTLDGHNAMPARGGCFECSDAQLRQALDYLRTQ